ncbi:MAG: LysM peptidoglycan-binding domain-containing protein [Bacteroidia bacterium]|nr:LysM peptidoglycan-binding domain-containing protein [Bacteroidia bacterium]MDW8302840.1 LysM peptidoglycan-binding domain-containing protein [Bacteroidia bacterium]
MKKAVLFFLSLAVYARIYSQPNKSLSGATSTQKDPINSEIIQRLDSLTYMVYKNARTYPVDTARINKYNFAPELIPDYTDEEYERRLSLIPSVIPLVYHEDVGKFIRMYAKRREQVGRLLGLQSVYFPIFEEALDRHGLPIELKYLPIIESAFNPAATSRAGAVGLWQFIHSTGKMHGLKINSYIDERRDPFKETEAACVLLKTLYEIYGDWHLVLAAYNCGPGTVNRAIQMANGSLNYWIIRQYLPGETRNYVPGFIAAVYIMHYYAEHNLYPKLTDFTYFGDTLHITSYLDLTQFAKNVGIDPDELKAMNPELKRGVVVKSAEPYVLRVPYGINKKVNENRAAYLGAGAVATISPQQQLQQKINDGSIYKEPKNKQITHIVQPGETVSEIAQKYEVSKQDLCAWNNISGDKIWAGKKLYIYKPDESGEIIDKTKLAQTKTAKVNSYSRHNLYSQSQKVIYYTVQNGDSLWLIAHKHGVTVNDLKQWNNLNGNRLQPGQVLIVGKI